jgi:hypothetical protein
MASSSYSPSTYMDFFQSAAQASDTIDANLGSNFINTGTGSRTITINNLKDGMTVSIVCPGATGNVITIAAHADNGVTPLTVKYGAGQDGTMISAYSLFTVFRVGGSLNWAIVGPIHGIS